MSRLIVLTEAIKQKAREDFSAILDCVRDGRISYTECFDCENRKAVVLLTARAYNKILALLEKHGSEIETDALIHSDQGCHYTSHKFIDIIKDSSLRQSMSRRGNCWDNAPQESFFGHMYEG